MATYTSRHPLAHTSPLRSLPLYRSVQSVFGATKAAKVEAELRIAAEALAAELGCYAKVRAALGAANRRPVTWANGGVGCRRYHQAEAMRAINSRRRLIRAAQARLAAAQAAVAALVPADRFHTPYLAAMAAARASASASAALAA